MQNSLSDPFLISQYHQEYLSLINHYSNFKRPGMFVRYYNINYQESDMHPVVNSTFDLYSTSNINFNIHELTPVYNISPIINSTTFLPEKKGQIYDGVSSITIYTIQTPHINDLVTFYDPVRSGEVFRVMNIRTSINAYYSEPKLTWYEMDLEVAPIKDTSTLRISNHYIYDLHKEKYHNYVDYNDKMLFIETVNGVISQLNQFYSRNHDLYKVNSFIPLISNFTINKFKISTVLDDNYVRLFNSLEKPYRFLDLFPDEVPTYDYTQPFLDVHDLITCETVECEWDQIEGNISLTTITSGSTDFSITPTVSGALDDDEENLSILIRLTRDLQLLMDNNTKYF